MAREAARNGFQNHLNDWVDADNATPSLLLLGAERARNFAQARTEKRYL